MPYTLRRVDTGDDTLAELDVLIGFDDDLAGQATPISNRIRGLLTGIHPALERVLGPRVTTPPCSKSSLAAVALPEFALPESALPASAT